MTILDAANELHKKYSTEGWYLGTGIAEIKKIIYVYVKKNSKCINDLFQQGWMGYDVVVRPLGKIVM